MKDVTEQVKSAYQAKTVIHALSTTEKNQLLHAIADHLIKHTPIILKANQQDIESGKAANLSTALLDRLSLSADRIHAMSDSINDIASLEDPIGTCLDEWVQPNGLNIQKIRVPLGCIGMIYEARPNVTVDAIALAIKTNNAVVLRGSQSAYHSNFAITELCKEVVYQLHGNADFIQLLEDTHRDSVKTFIQLNDYLDLVIPRGSAGLIQLVVQSSTVPTIETGVGNCHVYIDDACNESDALAISDNAKTHRPSVCNACETLLVHQDIAPSFLPKLASIFDEKNVEIRGCKRTQDLLPTCKHAEEADWDTEFLDLIIAIKIVASLDEALDHIRTHGSHHSEAIVSEDPKSIERFKHDVDASTILVNASTRFTDGGEFGFGAEIGISTQKLHARGPMGIKELTSYTFIVTGKGHVRA
ncbi:glutamate-5-semialdehyde dehydrogenase [bacterium]|nr:glutamate-5-semialdehyde dehydrogenase [bacterium]